jgi:hypothetical protein
VARERVIDCFPQSATGPVVRSRRESFECRIALERFVKL